MASTLAAIKAASHAKDAREKRDTDFHKTALVLAREYLRANGYSKSCDALAKEVGSGLEKLELADVAGYFGSLLLSLPVPLAGLLGWLLWLVR